MLTLMRKGEEFSPPLEQVIGTVYRDMVERLIKHGTEEQLAALLPKTTVRSRPTITAS